MVARPQQARLLAEFGGQYADTPNDDQYHHEEDLCSYLPRRLSRSKLWTLSRSSVRWESHSRMISQNFSHLTHGISSTILLSTQSARSVEAVGKKQYETYKKSVLTDATHSIHDPIKKNKLPLIRSPTPKTKSKQVVG